MIEKELKQLSDTELVQLFQGEKQDMVFEELYVRYKDMIFNYIKRFLYNLPDDLALDLVSEIFIKAYQKIATLKNPHAFKMWLYRMARNMSINYIASNKFPYVSLDNKNNNLMTNNIKDERINIEDSVFHEQIRTLVFSELEKLDGKTREIIVLKFLNQLTYEEINHITHIPLRTLKDKVKKGFCKINEKLKNMGYI